MCLKKYFEKHVHWEDYRFLKCFPRAKYFWIISSEPPSTGTEEAELIIFVNLKIILDSGERLALVFSSAITDAEGKIVSENKLSDNFKENFLLNLDR